MTARSSTSVWIVSFDHLLADALSHAIPLATESGVEVVSPAAATDRLARNETPALVILDLRTTSSWDLLPHLASAVQERADRCPSIVGIAGARMPLTHAVLADQLIQEFLSWPADSSTLDATLRSAMWKVEQSQGTTNEHREVRGLDRVFKTFAPSMFSVMERLEVVARHDFTVLLVGETGTGKTTFAQLIHDLSSRRSGRFLTVGCGALPRDVIDSELFGHMKGAFTGADQTKEGKFEAAADGSILLDEIDVLGLMQQAKLLRVLETGEFEPVGSNDTRQVKTRTIVASNHCLETLIAKQTFRADLYFRLNQVKLEIPPLRERREDIVPLAVEFIEECCRENGISAEALEPSLPGRLKSYRWPGNVRELRNEVRRAVLFSRDGLISSDALAPEIVRDKPAQKPAEEKTAVSLAGEVALTEQAAIEQMLAAQNFNRAATARALGISRVTLYNKIRKYSIQIDPKSGEEA
ncbi:MAG: sigma-54-dependent Fis family transcriptional regulator [Planctomycetales bacterium]|nr:sigma-54-dependent Fis family transcriptional regulator [Planctomycetales bacterium]